ncbi:MAG: Maf family protein [Planctomycetaceae bacterium]|nr:Maf family protein [Planctomycetaceae bacterium]
MTVEFTRSAIDRWHWILASASPRRRQLLAEAGFRFDVISASAAVEDDIRNGEAPAQYVARQARQKAEDVAGLIRHGEIAFADAIQRSVVVIGCDTVAVCDGAILGKPQNIDDARRMLRLLGGQRHEAMSGLCLINTATGETFVETERSVLYMHMMSDETLEAYLTLHQWEGKAGAFGYQDGIDWLEIVEGSESNVVGLPLELLKKMICNLSWEFGSRSSDDLERARQSC